MGFRGFARRLPQIAIDGPVAHSRKRKRTDKFFGSLREDHINQSTSLLKTTDQLDRFIGCYAATDTDDNPPVS
jgi:hypothetical protein